MKILPPPGPGRIRQLALLGVLLVAAAYALWRVLGPPPAGPPPPASNPQVRPTVPAAPAAGPAAEPQKTMPQPVQLGKLEPVPEEPAATRNPFRFGVKPAPPPPPAPAYVPPPQPSGPPPPPPVPPIPLKFIGRVVMPDKRVVASLSDGRGNVLRGTEGQVIDGRYRVVRIGDESIVMEYVNGTGRQTLPLRGS